MPMVTISRRVDSTFSFIVKDTQVRWADDGFDIRIEGDFVAAGKLPQLGVETVRVFGQRVQG